MILRRRAFTVYCDGASRKDGRGGWGYAVYEGSVLLRSDCGGEYDTTNNRMELMGAIKALRTFTPGTAVKVVSDSQYVVKGITEYLDDWLQRNWRTGGNKPVKNQDLWEQLGHLDADRKVTWEWVKGHTGNPGNEMADSLATKGVPP